MRKKIQLWQWPNLLAIDAAIIAITWQWVFIMKAMASWTLAGAVTLALSVWLTYTADRLFDVSGRPMRDLLSLRHRFAKQYSTALWIAWGTTLVANLSIAFSSLSSSQLRNGFILLVFCLTYTILNQLFSRRFFPKEILVALIFTAGTHLFLEHPPDVLTTLSFALLCFANCLIIAFKEKDVDTLLRISSITSRLSSNSTLLILLIAATCAAMSESALPLIPSISALAFLQIGAKKIPTELFRVLCDAALLLGPLVYFFASGVFVR